MPGEPPTLPAPERRSTADPPKLKIRLGSGRSSQSQLTATTPGGGTSSPRNNGPTAPSPLVARGIVAASPLSISTPAGTPAENGHHVPNDNGLPNLPVRGDDIMQDAGRPPSASLKIKLGSKGKQRAVDQDGNNIDDGNAQAEQLKREAEEILRTRQQLENDLLELPDVARQHLVPLYEVVRKVVARSFSELQSLVEILPAKNDDNRKRAIIAYVVSNRRQIIKLLVLLRWSRDSTQEVERCMNLVAFLQRQNFQLERAVESLKATRESLLTARVRNYDLVTAVDVFSAGTYTRLPNMFKDTFIAPKKMSATEVLQLLQELESVIRYRLQLHEYIPLQLLQNPHQIHDGRVTFHAPGLFKASFTLGGDTLDHQWYLVDFSFDIRGRNISQRPSSVMMEHIVQLSNEMLSKCASPVPQAAPSIEAEGKPPDQPQKTWAFVQAFEMFQDLSLYYQLEVLQYHAVQANTAPTIWQNRLNISMSKDRSRLEVWYNKPFPRHPSQYFMHPDQQCVFTIEMTPNHTPAAGRSSRAITTMLSALSERLARTSLASSAAASAAAPLTASSEPLATTTVSKMIRCSFIRTPVWYDLKGRRLTQLPPALAAQMQVQATETKEISLYANLGSAELSPQLRDIDSILDECFR